MNSKKANFINFILDNLSQKERSEFLKELLEDSSALKDAEEIISSWECTAEINSNPIIKNKILSRSKKLKLLLLRSKKKA